MSVIVGENEKTDIRTLMRLCMRTACSFGDEHGVHSPRSKQEKTFRRIRNHCKRKITPLSQEKDFFLDSCPLNCW